MRLICGVIHFNFTPVNPFLLHRMCAAMIAPGLQPAKICWQNSRAALAVLDFDLQSRETGRIRRRDSGGILACDARLDELPASSPGSETCCEQLLDRHGAGRLSTLSGDFALADWNTETQELVLARDAAGIRPLVFHHVPGVLVAFASFPRALHAVQLPERRVATGSLVREMLGVSSHAETLFADLEAVPPNSAITFSARGRRLARHSLPRPAAKAPRTPREGAQALRAALESAVASRIPAGSGPVATHLSGGLDSSAITVLAARILREEGRRLLACSMLRPARNPGPESDQAYIQAVLDQEPSIEWFHAPLGNPFDRQSKSDRVLSDADDDPENAICAHVSAQGATMLLSGWGGDEGATFNARGALADAFLHGRLSYMGRELLRIRRERSFSTSGILRGELLHFLRADLRSLLSGGRHQPRHQGSSLVRPALLHNALGAAGTVPRMGSSIRRNQQQLLTGRHLEMRAGNWAEIGARYGMAFSFPMLDRRVVAAALGMHPTWHLREGWKRRPFRDATEGILPESIRWRHDKKTPFPEVHARLASRHQDVLAEIDALCARPEIAEIFDLSEIHALKRDFPSLPDLLADPTHAETMLPMVRWMSYGRFLTQAGSDSSSYPGSHSNQEAP